MRFITWMLLVWNLMAWQGGIALRPTLPQNPQSPSEGVVAGELIVGVKSGYKTTALALPAGVSVARTSPQLSALGAAVLKVPAGQERLYAQKMQNVAGVQFAEPNYLVSPQAFAPNDPLWPQQYGPAHLRAPEAWLVTTGSESIILAVIDSGIDSSHPEFAGRILPGYDFVDHDTTPQDTCGHGTHVAGIAAAAGNNGLGIAGLAWQVKIMPVRVLGGYCFGSVSDIAEALVWAVERGARVINLSLGTSAPSTLLENGTHYAYTHGAALFAAAGNAGMSPVFYPAAYPWVMAVGATDVNDQQTSYSNTGAALDLMAPGSGILSTTPLSDFYYHHLYGTELEYGLLGGTSMAAAHASGAAALLASLPQFDTPDKIYQALTSTALDLDAPGRDDNTGYGLIQVDAALAFSPTVVTPPPTPPAVSYAILDSNYCDNLIQYHWQDAATGSWLPVFGNDGYAAVSLPFTFQFGGVTYDTVTVSANGYLTFGGDGSIGDNFLLPGVAQPNNVIAPFWDDLNPSAGGLLYHKVLGAAPNRQYVVQWDKVPFAGSTIAESLLTFQVVLFESSNQILFQYQTLKGQGADGSSSTIGVEYADGLAGQLYSYNQPGAVKPGQALLFAPYQTGDPPPFNNCNTFTRLVDSQGGFFDPRPFCVEIPAGVLQEATTLQIKDLSHAPALPSGFIALGHYAEIRLSYFPPPPLSPTPEAYVCYHYTPSDVLRAGGHPENLLLAAYDASKRKWEILSTAANEAQSLLSARAPHFSIYAVVTRGAPEQLPVTGQFLAPSLQVGLAILCSLILLGGLGLLRRRSAP